MNPEEEKEYHEKMGSPEMEYLRYQMENPMPNKPLEEVIEKRNMTPYEIIKQAQEEFEKDFMEYSQENGNTLIDPDTDGKHIKSHSLKTSLALIESIEKMVGYKYYDYENQDPANFVKHFKNDLLLSLQSEKEKVSKLLDK